jgi:hypothetical protein
MVLADRGFTVLPAPVRLAAAAGPLPLLVPAAFGTTRGLGNPVGPEPFDRGLVLPVEWIEVALQTAASDV